MGCWNGTCGVSQLHIRHGQRVMVVPLVQSHRDSLCYSTPYYTPFAIPFFSEYNDYGAGENSEGIGLKLVLEEIKSKLIEMEQGENEYHDIPVNVEGFDEEMFWEAIHERRLFVKSPFRNEKQLEVGFTMIHMDVLDHLAENYKFEDYDYNSETGRSAYYYYGLQDLLDGVPEIVDLVLSGPTPDQQKLRDALQGRGDELTEEEYSEILESVEFLFGGIRKRAATLRYRPGSKRGYEDRLTNEEGFNRASSWLEHTDSHMMSAFSSYDLDRLTKPLIAAKDREGLIELLSMHLRLLFVDVFLMHTRKFWAPQAGAGSQSDMCDGYLALNAAIAHTIEKEKKRWAEEDGDDE